MNDAFAALDLPKSLLREDAALRAAYRDACKKVSSAAPASASTMARLSEAYQLLMSPAKRLRHWLELSGIPGEARGVVDGELLDWFIAVGSTIQEADQLLRKHEQCQSLLAKAILTGDMEQGRRKIEQRQQELTELLEKKTALLPLIEAGAIDHASAWVCVRDLAFIEKWQQQLRERYGRFFG